MRRTVNRPEEDLQRSIVRYLGVALPRGAFMFAVPNQRGTRKRFEMGILKAMGVRAGVPDLCILYGGMFFGIEVKAPKGGKTTDKQDSAATAIRSAGGFYEIVRSVEEVERFLRSWAVPLSATVCPEPVAA